MIQWSTGRAEREAIVAIHGRPDMALVGAWVHSEEKSGRDVGEIAGIGPLGIVASTAKDAVLATPADCVCYMAGRT